MTNLPSFPAQRAAIAAVLQSVDAVLYETAPTGPMPTAFVMIGMPSWLPPTDAVGWHRVTWPVVVAVSRSGRNDAADASRLETLWPAAFEALDTASDIDPTMAGTCYSASISEAHFSPITIAGTEYPAQIINLILNGE